MTRPRRLVTLGVLAVALAAPPTGGLAAPAGEHRTTPSAAADRDHDKVSDDFQPRLRAAHDDDTFAVVVTGLSSAQARAAVGSFPVRRELGLVHGFAATVTARQARALAHDQRTRRVEEDRVLRITDTATDADYGAAAARSAFGLTGAGIGICTIDTGVDPAHEQIAPRSVVFKDFIGTATTAYDDHGHGTHVMSIAAGDGTGGAAAAAHTGVAPGATLYAAKALDSSGSGADSGIVAAVQWCAGQAAVRVVSMSLGDQSASDGNDALSQAVDAAVGLGKVVVVAAGNAGDAPQTVPSPGAARLAITVGAGSDHSAPAGAAYADAGIFLAPFSSRGPTLDGRVKPDVVGPGVTVEAAQSGTTAGYVEHSGTSMATPYVAGVVALGLQAVPTATPAQVAAALTATAEDWGAPGKDNEWGAGLVDAKAFVSRLQGGSDPGAPYPTHTRVTGSVPNNGSTSVPIQVSSLGVPLAVTVTLAGQAVCYYGCLVVEWGPDLDVELRDPTGAVVDSSQCALDDPCGIGRQETVTARPTVLGTWTLRVFAFTGDPNNGRGGSFAADISRGPLVTGGAPPANQAPVANAGPDRTVRPGKQGTASFTLDGRGSTDPDGGTLSYLWEQTSPALGSPVGTTPTVTLTRGIGTYVFRLTVSDGALSSTDAVTITVKRK
jgi:serine protease AprX